MKPLNSSAMQPYETRSWIRDLGFASKGQSDGFRTQKNVLDNGWRGRDRVVAVNCKPLGLLRLVLGVVVLLFFSSVCGSLALAQDYSLSLVTDTGSYKSIDPNLSINDDDLIAFAGEDGECSKVFGHHGPTKDQVFALSMPDCGDGKRVFHGASISMTEVVSMDQVAADRFVPPQFIRAWDLLNPDFGYRIIAQSDFDNQAKPGEVAIAFMAGNIASNRYGSVAFPAAWYAAYDYDISYTFWLFFGPGFDTPYPFLNSGPGSETWPQISENGDIVYRDHVGNIIFNRFNIDEIDSRVISGGAIAHNGMKPGISEDGSVVAFANEEWVYGTTQIYASVDLGGKQRELYMIASPQDSYKEGEFASLDAALDDRIAVKSISFSLPDERKGKLITVVFQGKKFGDVPGSSFSGLFSVDLLIIANSKGEPVFKAQATPRVIARVGDLLGGNTIVGFSLYKPINSKGNLAFYVDYGNSKGGVVFAQRNCSIDMSKFTYYSQNKTDNFSQGTTRWGGEYYGNSEGITNTTMNYYGCQLTSFAMLASYHAGYKDTYYNTNPSCSWPDPGVLNDSLKRPELRRYLDKYKLYCQPALDFPYDNGFTDYDYVRNPPEGNDFVPSEVARYARNQGIPIYHHPAATLDIRQDNIVDFYLCNGEPVVLKVLHEGEKHFVLATGKGKGADGKPTYLIQDPGPPIADVFKPCGCADNPAKCQDLICGYGNTYVGIRAWSRIYDPSAKTGLTASLGSPAELSFVDLEGRRLGVDPDSPGSLINEVPNAAYIDNDYDDIEGNPVHVGKSLTIDGLDDGNYFLKVIGTGTGPYTLMVYKHDPVGLANKQIIHGNTTPGQVDEFVISYSADEDVPLQVDPKWGIFVPDVVNSLRASAEAAIVAANLVVGAVTLSVSETVSAGRVISQSPAGWVQVVGGSAVNLVVSSGSAFSFVPDVVDLAQAVAEADIIEANLVVGTVSTTSSRVVPAGTVLSQDPLPETQLSAGSAVNLVVSSGPAKVTVGFYIGYQYYFDYPVSTIIPAGLVVGDITYTTDCWAGNIGRVISQEPKPYTEVLEGTAVNFVICVSSGMIAVPNVVNMPMSSVEATLAEANLAVGTITKAGSTTVSLGNVINQIPAAGAIVAEGSPVSLVVSLGLMFVEKQIVALDPGREDQFGQSVSIDGDTIAIGAWLDDDHGKDSGSVYLFDRNQGGPNNWGQVKKLTAYDGISNEYFGNSVVIRGDTLVVGARASGGWGNWFGAVYVYYRNEGGPDNWGLVQKITASDSRSELQLGWGVSLDGDTIVAGAIYSTYIFYRNLGGADNWGEVKKITGIGGEPVSISGDTLVVGAYIFRKNQGGVDNWGQIKMLTPPEGEGYYGFGGHVSISGSTLVIAEVGTGTTGSAFIYYRNQGGTNNWGCIKNVVPSGGVVVDGVSSFGWSVSIDGDTLLVGASYAQGQIGAAYIFRRNEGGTDNWGESARIAASDASHATYPAIMFGNSVSIAGDTFVVGAWFTFVDEVWAGSAYVYYPVKLRLVTDVDSLTVLEGSSASFKVKLSAQPPSDVIVSVSRVSGDADITVQSGATLTFTPSNWNVYQTVTLAAAEDADIVNGSATIRLEAEGIEPKDVTATEADNDVFNFVTDTDVVTVPEGGTAQFQVKLSMPPTMDIVVNVSFMEGVEGDEDITVQSGSVLTFTPLNWNVFQTVTLAAAKDLDSVNGTAFIWLRAPYVLDKVVTATEADNDPVTPVTDVDVVSVPEGGVAYFHVKLGRPPESDLTLSVSRMSGDTDITIYYGQSLTFTPSNWDEYQTVTLAAAEDNDVCNGTATIRIGAPGAQPKYVTAIEADKDTLAFVTDTDALTVVEADTGNFNVKLNRMPCSDVVVSVTRVSGGSNFTVDSGSSLTFTPANWNMDQSVTLAAAKDPDGIEETAIIRLSAAGLADKDIKVTEHEIDPLQQTFVTNTDTVAVPEGMTATFQARLLLKPASGVSVSVSRVSGDADITVQSGGTLTFTTTNWDTYQTVTLTAAKDIDVCNGTATIRLSATDVVDKDVTATEIDNDTITFVTSTDALTVPEEGTAQFQVKLSNQPCADVVVSAIRVSGDADITIQSGGTLTFTPSNWNVYQTVTLAAAADIDVCNGTASIRLSATGAPNKDVTATEADNDVLAFVTNTDSVTVPEEGTAQFQVKLSNQPCANVAVSVARVSGDTDITVKSGGALTFTPSNWSIYQTVTLAAAKDLDASNGTAFIRLSAAGMPYKDVTATEADNDLLPVIFTTSTDTVTVPEEGTAQFQVKLAAQPPWDVIVSVGRVSGDTDITVQSGGILTFTPSNWNIYQAVTLSAAKDFDIANGTATIRVSATGIPSKDITATEQDNDVAQPLPFFDDFSTDKGWFGYRSGGWERKPAKAGGGENGSPDPETDYSSTGDDNILGYAIGGDYPDDMEEDSIISPPIDCSWEEQVYLKFRRWLNVEGHDSDHARIYVSNDAINWYPVWENPGYDLTDSEWVQKVIDISDYAGKQATVYIKFAMGPTNSTRGFSGWNIDDFEVTSASIYPAEGTIGTEVWIPNDGYGLKKGKVLIGTAALKVVSWTDTLIHCLLSKALPHGVYDLTVVKKVKGAAPVVMDSYFSVMPPEIESLSSDSGTVGQTITINGKFFGTKKGKVTIGGKSCKVTSWTMDATTGTSTIHFLVPKGLSAGPYALKVINKVGEGTDTFRID